MATDGLRTTAVLRAMARPDLVMGCERQLFLLTALVCATLIAVIQTWVAVATGVVTWMVVVGVLRRSAKADPEMSRVYVRHVRYRPWYPARATPWAEPARHRRD